MKLHPKRDGNPKRFFYGCIPAKSLNPGRATPFRRPRGTRELPHHLCPPFVDVPLVGAVAYWLSDLPQRLSYELQGPVLTIHYPFGHLTVHRSEVEEVKLVSYVLSWWTRRGGNLHAGLPL